MRKDGSGIKYRCNNGSPKTFFPIIKHGALAGGHGALGLQGAQEEFSVP